MLIYICISLAGNRNSDITGNITDIQYTIQTYVQLKSSNKWKPQIQLGLSFSTNPKLFHIFQSFRSQHRAVWVSSSEIFKYFTFLRYSWHYSKFSTPAICISVSQQQRSQPLVLQDLPSLVYICRPWAGNRNIDITDNIQTYNTKHAHLKVIRALVFFEKLSELSFNH